MIHRALASKLFEAFSISRWNDRIRPIELTEMDKHAFKSILTYFIGKMEEADGKNIDWEYIVYGNIFALLKNIALSDIKAPIISELKKNNPTEYEKLNKWVVNQYKPYINDTELLTLFEKFLIESDSSHELELQILRAAHKYSSKREFDIIKPANENIFPEIQKIDGHLLKELEDFTNLRAISLLNNHSDFYNFICIIEQLRCQTRWSQTARIPQTNVLGHCMYVAALSFFLSRDINACEKRLVNNFYASLFHDLPESVTRDIISPVKRATETLPQIIKEIEHNVCSRELYPKIPENILPDLLYLLGDIEGSNNNEYGDRIRTKEGFIKWLTKSDDMANYNSDEYDPIDGCLIKLCDEISAYMEAFKSIEHGISTHHLQEGLSYIRNKYMTAELVQGLPVNEFFIEFD